MSAKGWAIVSGCMIIAATTSTFATASDCCRPQQSSYWYRGNGQPSGNGAGGNSATVSDTEAAEIESEAELVDKLLPVAQQLIALLQQRGGGNASNPPSTGGGATAPAAGGSSGTKTPTASQLDAKLKALEGRVKTLEKKAGIVDPSIDKAIADELKTNREATEQNREAIKKLEGKIDELLKKSAEPKPKPDPEAASASDNGEQALAAVLKRLDQHHEAAMVILEQIRDKQQ